MQRILSRWILLITAILFTQTAMSQKTDYNGNWKKVEELEGKGLTKTANEEVLKIIRMAIADKNEQQQVKAALYMVKYRSMVEEESQENNFFMLDSLAAKAKAPTRNILQSLQAGLLWQYVNNYRWKFYNRTKLLDEKSKDISTWSIDKLFGTIGNLFKASLSGADVLKNTKLEEYDAVIVKGVNTSALMPTLYDLLTDRALDFFSNDEKDISKPAYAFTISDEKAFEPAAAFVNAGFKTKDTASLYYKAVVIFQDLLKFHLNDAKPDALIDADIRRLTFMNQRSVLDNKTNLYEAALKKIEDKYGAYAASAMASYLKAVITYTRGTSYDPFAKTDVQYDIKLTKELCEAIVAKYPASEGGILAYNLIQTIKSPALSFETEKVNIPGQPFRSLVSYKNIKKLYFRVIKTSHDELQKFDRRDYDKLWKTYVALKPMRTWNLDLPDLQDYQTHALEIKVDALPSGSYIILSSPDEKFSLEKNIIARQVTYVSSLSLVHNGSDYYVVNRDNGQPVANAKVQAWENQYNYNSSQYEEKKAESYVTDANGYFRIKEQKDSRSTAWQISSGNDELFTNETSYTYNYYYSSYTEEPKPFTSLFTDRSIYRPGQTIYFKGIVIKSDRKTRKSEVIPNFKTIVTLFDNNGQKVKDISVTSNDFGSYNGSFKITEGLLNGNFRIQDNTTGSNHYISVEEYKRPKFFADVQKPKGSYRVNDSIKVTGTAKAYAGNNIDGAKVSYRIVRKVQYPIWWGWWSYSRSKRPNSGNTDMEIGSGTVTTDAKGEFQVTFKAIPDLSAKKSDQPTFYYDISVDITDINGETRSASTSVAVAYQAIQLNIEAPAKISTDSLKNILVKSTNMNGIEEKAKAELSIQKLKSPGQIFRDRLWDQPDLFIMSKEAYYAAFPYDVYKDEHLVNNYPVEGKVFGNTDSTNGNVDLSKANLDAGWYKITATAKDKFGEEVKAEKYILLIDEKSPVTSTDEKVTLTSKKNTLAPGEHINYKITTGFPNAWIITATKKMDDKDERFPARAVSRISNNTPVNTDVVVREADRGGVAVSYILVQHNRVYTGSEAFGVPWTNKMLNISYNTFRDKLLPGASEKWSIKVTGNQGEKVAAEMLVSMYDASLDQYKPQSWFSLLGIWPSLYGSTAWESIAFDKVASESYTKMDYDYKTPAEKIYPYLAIKKLNGDAEYLWWLKGGSGNYRGYYANFGDREMISSRGNFDFISMDAAPPMPVMLEKALQGKVSGIDLKKSANATFQHDMNPDAVFKETTAVPFLRVGDNNADGSADVQIRKNFNETAFFFPDLKTDTEGNVEFSFTIPEALTEWKLMTMAYTKDLASAYDQKKVITQKPLMVQPNAPRFLREGDRMEFSAKIVNMGETEVTGTAQLELIDAATNKPIDGWFKNIFPSQYFTIAAGQSGVVKFPIEIPFNFNSALTYRIIAKTNNASDGEEMALPVLTNRTLVTETLPLNVRKTNKKDFKFDKLLNSGSSSTLKTNALTVEYTSNPAWYAVQALPYLMEYPYECAEQTFNRYYANMLAAYISNSAPRIKAVFEKWKTLDTAALLSNLQKNEELKSALLQETPWVLAAQNESQQKKNIALLFDMVKMSSESNKALNKLKDMQSSNGGFVWFKGGPDDRYITQYIVTGVGHLRKLDALKGGEYEKMKPVIDNAIPYLDRKIKEEYDDLLRYKVNLAENHLSGSAIQYLYMRSFFTEYKIADASLTAVNYYKGQAKKYWLSQSKYMQAMIALGLYRDKDAVTPVAIIKSLKDNSIINEELGMYWKEFDNGGYYWYQAPIESQALMIEAFSDIEKNMGTVDDLKTWLLKNKQTMNWKTTKATSEACYALLLNGSNWLSEEKQVTITLGNTVVSSNNSKTEAGTGYFKQRIEGDRVTPSMGNINVNISSSSNPASTATSWGAVYWQYFEDLDKITAAETPLKLKKQLFIQRNTDRGPVLDALADGAELKIGDKVVARILLKVDRDMEYIHMKDMRAACMEPVNVISQYKWQDGLGYYETTKDASTNFFFGGLPKGSYVFEYPMFVTHAGNFSNGITTIQCMYAPEFTSHSEGIRVNVE